MRVRNIAVYEHLKAVYARTIIDHEGDLYATDRRSWSIHKTQGIHSPTFLGSHNQSCRQFAYSYNMGAGHCKTFRRSAGSSRDTRDTSATGVYQARGKLSLRKNFEDHVVKSETNARIHSQALYLRLP